MTVVFTHMLVLSLKAIMFSVANLTLNMFKHLEGGREYLQVCFAMAIQLCISHMLSGRIDGCQHTSTPRALVGNH